MAGLPLAVELELNRRSAAALADEVERTMAEASRNIKADFNRSMSGLGADGFRKVGRDAGNNLRDGIRGGMDEAMRGVTGQFGEMGRVAQSTFSAMPRGASIAAAGVAGVGLAAVVVGKQLYDMGAQWDNVVDGITGKTGMVGAELTALTNTVKDLAATTALPIADIGNIAGSVSQAFKLSGADAEKMIQTLSQIQQLTGQGVNARGLSQAFRVFDITDADAQTDAVEGLLHMSQETGISINELASSMQKSGKATKEAGLDWGQTAALLSSFEAAGVDINRIMPSLSIALKNFAADGREPATALAETVTQIERLGDSPAARTLASDTFGRGYLDFLAAIQGTNVGDILSGANTALDDLGASLDDQITATEDWTEQWTKMSNRLQTEFEPTASQVFSTVGMYIEDYLIVPLRAAQGLMTSLERGGQGFGNASTSPAAPIAPGSPLGNMLLPNGQTTGLPNLTGTPAPTGPMGLWDTVSGVGGVTPFTGVPQGLWSQPDKNRSSGPSGPVVPYTGDPMSLLQGMTPTSSLYGAAEGVLTSQHAQAQAEAELNALKSDNASTGEEITAAENKLARARGDQLQAELRLNEAKASATEKFTGQLEELGAGLDSDFGISKGLAGIADNIVRFVGSLALAGPMAQMAAISNARGNEGSGLMGYLASTGALGSQFMPSYGGSTGSTGSYGATSYGGGFDAALLSNVPAGRYDSSGDLAQGLGDCSSAVEDLVNIMDGMPTAGRSMSTGNAAEWLQSRGFLPGSAPGAFNVGFNAGHMQATLPDGTPFNWGSDSAAASGGRDGGQGAFDPSLTERYYRPVGGMPVSMPSMPSIPSIPSPAAPSYAPSSPASLPTDPLSPSELVNPGLTDPTAPTTTRPTAGPPLSILPGAGAGAGGGGSLLPGLGMPQSAPFGRAPLGGQPYPAGPGGGEGGIGLSDGAMGALGAAASLFPGAGAGAQMAMQLANRTIKYAGQMAGIGVQGVLSAITPAGDNPKASIGNSWFGKVIGGIASAKPATPNAAGGKKPEGPPGPLSGTGGQQPQGQQGQGGNNVTLNQTNNRVSEEFATSSGVRELSAANFSNPGRQ